MPRTEQQQNPRQLRAPTAPRGKRVQSGGAGLCMSAAAAQAHGGSRRRPQKPKARARSRRASPRTRSVRVHAIQRVFCARFARPLAWPAHKPLAPLAREATARCPRPPRVLGRFAACALARPEPPTAPWLFLSTTAAVPSQTQPSPPPSPTHTLQPGMAEGKGTQTSTRMATAPRRSAPTPALGQPARHRACRDRRGATSGPRVPHDSLFRREGVSPFPSPIPGERGRLSFLKQSADPPRITL